MAAQLTPSIIFGFNQFETYCQSHAKISDENLIREINSSFQQLFRSATKLGSRIERSRARDFLNRSMGIEKELARKVANLSNHSPVITWQDWEAL